MLTQIVLQNTDAVDKVKRRFQITDPFNNLSNTFCWRTISTRSEVLCAGRQNFLSVVLTRFPTKEDDAKMNLTRRIEFATSSGSLYAIITLQCQAVMEKPTLSSALLEVARVRVSVRPLCN